MSNDCPTASAYSTNYARRCKKASKARTTMVPMAFFLYMLVEFLTLNIVEAFVNPNSGLKSSYSFKRRIANWKSDLVRPVSPLNLQKSWFDPDANSDDDVDDNNNNDDDEDRLVTREMLHRDLLQDPQVKRKSKSKNGKEGYKPLDNRDHLPFVVRKVTPDPYTPNEIKKAKQQRTSDGKKKRTDLDHHLTPVPKKKSSETTASRLVQSNKKKDGSDVSTVLGEFQLDKSTTSGDIIVVGNKEYQVQKARCQYKYAGGQRFVMVRKILEVKEVTRVYKEEALIRQYESSPSSRLADQPPPNLE